MHKRCGLNFGLWVFVVRICRMPIDSWSIMTWSCARKCAENRAHQVSFAHTFVACSPELSKMSHRKSGSHKRQIHRARTCKSLIGGTRTFPAIYFFRSFWCRWMVQESDKFRSDFNMYFFGSALSFSNAFSVAAFFQSDLHYCLHA